VRYDDNDKGKKIAKEDDPHNFWKIGEMKTT
jgi:hypothetical protein